MCYYDLFKFQKCSCQILGPFRRHCYWGRQRDNTCMIEKVYQDVLKRGKCDHCREKDIAMATFAMSQNLLQLSAELGSIRNREDSYTKEDPATIGIGDPLIQDENLEAKALTDFSVTVRSDCLQTKPLEKFKNTKSLEPEQNEDIPQDQEQASIVSLQENIQVSSINDIVPSKDIDQGQVSTRPIHQMKDGLIGSSVQNTSLNAQTAQENSQNFQKQTHSCSDCQVRFHDLTTYHDHLYEHHNVRSFQCEACHFRFRTPELVESHKLFCETKYLPTTINRASLDSSSAPTNLIKGSNSKDENIQLQGLHTQPISGIKTQRSMDNPDKIDHEYYRNPYSSVLLDLPEGGGVPLIGLEDFNEDDPMDIDNILSELKAISEETSRGRQYLKSIYHSHMEGLKALRMKSYEIEKRKGETFSEPGQSPESISSYFSTPNSCNIIQEPTESQINVELVRNDDFPMDFARAVPQYEHTFTKEGSSQLDCFSQAVSKEPTDIKGQMDELRPSTASRGPPDKVPTHTKDPNTTDLETVITEHEKLEECQLSLVGFRNGLKFYRESPSSDQVATSPTEAGQHSLNAQDNDEESIYQHVDTNSSRAKLQDINSKFWKTATDGFTKLRNHAFSERVTPAFRRFYDTLGDVMAIVDSGLDALENITNGDIPQSLKEMYCFLHVAYAMSQSQDEEIKLLDPASFASGISIFRNYLSSESEIQGEPSDQDLFDEIVTLMWDELNHGLSWIKEQSFSMYFPDLAFEDDETRQLTNILMNSCNPEEIDYAFSSNSNPECLPIDNDNISPSRNPTQNSCNIVTWEDAISGVVFSKVTRFLRSLEDVGIVFVYLCGTWSSALRTFILSSARKPDKRLRERDREIQDHIKDHLILPLRSKGFPGAAEICDVASYMLHTASLGDLSNFEQYVLGLAKVHKRSKDEFLQVVRIILAMFYICYYSLPESCKQRTNFAAWEQRSLESKIKDEEIWHLVSEDEETEVQSPMTSESEAEDSPKLHHRILEPRGSGYENSSEVTSNHLQTLDFTSSVIDPNILSLPLGSCQARSKPSTVEDVGELSISNLDTLLVNCSIDFESPKTSNLPISLPRPEVSANEITWEPVEMSKRPPSENRLNKPKNAKRPDTAIPNKKLARVCASPKFITYSAPSKRKRESKINNSRRNSLTDSGEDSKAEMQRKKRKLDPEDKPFSCDAPGCSHRETTIDNLRRHRQTVHGGDNVKNQVLFCDFPGCSSRTKGGRAVENMKTHKRIKHGAGGRKSNSKA